MQNWINGNYSHPVYRLGIVSQQDLLEDRDFQESQQSSLLASLDVCQGVDCMPPRGLPRHASTRAHYQSPRQNNSFQKKWRSVRPEFWLELGKGKLPDTNPPQHDLWLIILSSVPKQNHHSKTPLRKSRQETCICHHSLDEGRVHWSDENFSTLPGILQRW